MSAAAIGEPHRPLAEPCSGGGALALQCRQQAETVGSMQELSGRPHAGSRQQEVVMPMHSMPPAWPNT